MSKQRERSSAERYYTDGRCLHYDDIKLIPVDTDQYPYTQPEYENMWHIPGRTMMSTDALVTLANNRGVTITMTEHKGVSAQTTRLN